VESQGILSINASAPCQWRTRKSLKPNETLTSLHFKPAQQLHRLPQLFLPRLQPNQQLPQLGRLPRSILCTPCQRNNSKLLNSINSSFSTQERSSTWRVWRR
jgi:hypothetical protein